jgi:hypothetical protein
MMNKQLSLIRLRVCVFRYPLYFPDDIAIKEMFAGSEKQKPFKHKYLFRRLEHQKTANGLMQPNLRYNFPYSSQIKTPIISGHKSWLTV